MLDSHKDIYRHIQFYNGNYELENLMNYMYKVMLICIDIGGNGKLDSWHICQSAIKNIEQQR